ncbi:hypothetical protein M427DRAFT_156317 [Gonapodya prolifera JEL478]|uniref:TFIIS N-terminal domain-containing protein n=1 Tax=Gonapodya prolifera (strain JEL478) TaxID=1344416 RepID=A0A139AAZ6_GONPJ|nr:hypothetical protein M427DRAFT_156317 [Gonapodya prolifera JEL478]|eukprot:KXS13878.1 hypothetical protein M427DRAFT_156317 [Gonapodya prolifera JEL478]
MDERDRELFGGSDSELSSVNLSSSDDERKRDRSDKKKRRKKKREARGSESEGDEEDDGREEGDGGYEDLKFKKKRRKRRTEDGEAAGDYDEGRKKKKRSKRRDAEGGDGNGKPDGALDDAEPDSDENTTIRKRIDKEIKDALAAGKIKRQKKVRAVDGEVDLTTAGDEIASKLSEEMRRAAERDRGFIEQGQPALAKVKMVNAVKNHLSKHYLQDAFFDNGVLHAMREWLEPAKDGSLPPLLVQSAMLDVLEQLSLTKEMIRDSRIGRIVNFLGTSEKTTPEVQKRCKNLVLQWSKGLYGAHQPANRVEIEHRSRGPNSAPKARPYLTPTAPVAEMNEFDEKVYQGAVRPTIEPRLLKYAPKSEVSGDFAKRKSGGGGGGGEKDPLRKIQAIAQNKSSGPRIHIGGIGDRATSK